MVVDAHTHVFAALSERFPRDVHELFPAEAESSAEALLAEMERAGVDRAVIVPLSRHDQYVLDVLARHPDRFAAIGVAAPGPPDVDGYRRRADAGLQGLRLFGLGPEMLPLLAELERSDGKLWFYGGPEQMELLERALDDLPGLTVVLNHLGYWPGAFEADEHGRPRFADGYAGENLETVCGLARFPGVHVLLTGFYAFAREPCPYPDLLPVTAALLAAYGPDRLLAGSDFPWIAAEPGYGATLGAIDRHLASLDEGSRAAVHGGNAARLFSFG
jgi:predicted TIM-barrel fold metal-dependent hydrolase